MARVTPRSAKFSSLCECGNFGVCEYVTVAAVVFAPFLCSNARVSRREPTAEVIAAARQRLGTTVDGKYKLMSILGVGGMGIVYEAQHLYLGRSVALKVLHPRYEDAHDAAQRFLREARALGTVGNRAVVQVLDAGFFNTTTPYLVMERLHGENLKDRIRRRKALRVVQAATVLREMMKGLTAAHAKGIIHCDLKPENVFLVDGRIEAHSVKILDFGIARYCAEPSSTQSPDANGAEAHSVYGTAEYMAPEQILAAELDARTDVYAAGVVLFEALCGAPPFSPEPHNTVFVRILKSQPPPLVGLRETVPPRFAELILSCLAKSPDARPQSAADVCRLLDAMKLAPSNAPSSSEIRAANKKT